MRRKLKRRRPFGPQMFQLAKGLTFGEACKLASKKARRDFRAVSYDAKSGIVVLT